MRLITSENVNESGKYGNFSGGLGSIGLYELHNYDTL